MSIDTKGVFCEVFNHIGGVNVTSFEEFLSRTKNVARGYNPQVKEPALANANGAWYAWLLVIFGEAILAENARLKTFLKLPNVSSMPCSQLYVPKLHDLLKDFELKLRSVAGVNLVTSNPDFALLSKASEGRVYDFSGALTKEHLERYDLLYRQYSGSCELDDLTAYVGVKTSLRPDRRIQLLHEGSLMKAIYTHLKTRNWEIGANGIEYFALTLKMTNADEDGLRSVATHSITSASLKPERAVDGIFCVSSYEELSSFLTSR